MSGKIKYLAVARSDDRVIVASYTPRAGGGDAAEFATSVTAVLGAPGWASQVGPTSKLHLDNGPNTFHLMTGGDAASLFVYIAITASDYPRRYIFSAADGSKQGILGELRDSFSAAHGAAAQTAGENSLSKSAKRVMEGLAVRYDDLKNLDKVAKVRAQVDEVTDVMQENIAIVLKNADRVDDIEGKSGDLVNSATKFSKQSTQLRKTMQWRYYKMNAIIALIILTVLCYILVPIISKASRNKSE